MPYRNLPPHNFARLACSLSRHALSCSISAPKFMQGGLVTVVTHRGGHSTDALKGWSGHMPRELGI